MQFLRYFYHINAVSNHLQLRNAKELLTAFASSVLGTRKQKTGGAPATFAEIFACLFQWILDLEQFYGHVDISQMG